VQPAEVGGEQVLVEPVRAREGAEDVAEVGLVGAAGDVALKALLEGEIKESSSCAQQ